MGNKDGSISPRNGHTLMVLAVNRISGGPNQKEASLDDQQDHAREWVADEYDGPVEFRFISTINKGERLDRPELREIEEELRTGGFDLFFAEDLGRIVRGTAVVALCGIAVDHGTRVIAPNDGFDTNDETWEEDAISACKDHVAHNGHTSKRLKHKLMNRFKKSGGAMAREIYGYTVPDDARTYADWVLDAAATPIFQEWFARLRRDRNCSAVADWLNSKGVPVGPYARNQKWDGRMVRRVTANPVLKGTPWRGRMHTVKHNESGRRKSVRNPKGPKYLECPHLAHVDPVEFEEVNALLEAANRGMGRKLIEGKDARAGVPKKRTVFPGQHAVCGVCNRLFYWGGHGQNDHMMCSGVRDYKCWNAVTFDGRDAARRMLQAVLGQIARLPDFDAVFLGKVRADADKRLSAKDGDLRQARQELESVFKQEANVADAIADMGLTDILRKKHRQLQDRKRNLEARLRRLTRTPAEELVFPSMPELRQRAVTALEEAESDPAEFGRLMRLLVPRLRIFPVQLCDGGGLTSRAELMLDLAALLPDRDLGNEATVLRSELTVDLFDPPQRAAFRERVTQLREQGMTERKVAETLGLTVTAVQNASALERTMREQGLTDPYLLVGEPPADCSRIRRHLNQRYRFEPLPLDGLS
ncbi:recombinase family protein [Zavarzinella formosa]|uniref:recombinase family protein n=1 Tax=Zavarzinella formosa TaxID=360055 RepID=UPI0002DEAAA5|nr:recombinase family protein [Zavarzinella formosa]